MGFDPNDFAYCILTQEPDVQPIPILMHCEVDEFLDGSYTLDVMAVGFGKAGNLGGEESGRKRWSAASTQMATSITNTFDQISLGQFTTFVPGRGLEGDSGGLLALQLPDGSWRAMGVFATPNSVVPAWNFVEWMLTDDEVAAQSESFIPCHEGDGTWAPGPECGGFPESPDSGEGQWSRGPLACYSDDLGGYSATCGAPYMPFIPPEAPLTLEKPVADVTSQPVPGCSATGLHSDLQGLMATFLVLVSVLRRQRRFISAGVFAILFATGCQDDSPLTDETGTGDPGDGDGDTPDPLEVNPNISHVTSGIYFPGDKYEEIAVGNVARAISSSTCCQDYVIGGKGEASARLLFGGGSTTHGLTFLSETADQTFSMADMGEGIDDLALADLDDDGDNDLVALLTNGELGVRLGNASLMTSLAGLTQYSAQSGMVVGGGKLAIGDMDCDDDSDVAVTAPTNDAVIILFNNGSGAFGSPEVFDVGENPQDVAVGDMDGSAPLDIVTVNVDGTMSIGIANECERERPEVEGPVEFISFVDPPCMFSNTSCVTDTANATVDIFTACGEEENDIVIAFADSVYAYCNEGDGVTFAEGEMGAWTIRWDLNGEPYPQDALNRPAHSPQLWVLPEEPNTMFAAYNQHIAQLSIEHNAYGKNYLPILALRSGHRSLEMVLSSHTGAGADWWQRAAWVGDRRTWALTGDLAADGQMGFGR
jgi:hypothetical protein